MTVHESRREKLNALLAQGIAPFPYRYDPTHRSGRIRAEHDALERAGVAVRVAGRLMTKRGHGKASFAHIKDADGLLQIYLREDALGPDAYARVLHFDLGDWIGVEGTVFRTRTGEITLKADRVEFLAKSLRPLPEKWHGLTDVEVRYRQRYTDLVVNDEVRALFRARARIIRSLREFLDAREYLEVETPVLQTLHGGASARPFVTHHNALDMTLYLRIALELPLKRLLVGGLDRVYELSRVFRNEGIDRQHNPEFTMLEFYQAYADYEVMMEVTQDLILHAVRSLAETTDVPFGEDLISFAPPWPRVSFTEAAARALGVPVLPEDTAELRKLADSVGVATDPKQLRGQILDDVVSTCVQPSLRNPTFLIDHPRDISPLAKVKRGDPSVVERFEVIVAGMELANAFTEQNDPDAQRAAFEQQMERRRMGDEEAQPLDEDYVRALEVGLPPTGGVGVGVDRLVMLLTNTASIRDVILFPHLRPEEGVGP